MEIGPLVLVSLAAFAAGLVNALAGGGTLITFPALVALGLPAVNANITSTVSLFPGYFGATWAQRTDLKGQGHRLFRFIPAGLIGGLAGGFLLLSSGEKAFQKVVPFLILFATLLLAVVEPLRKHIQKRLEGKILRSSENIASALPITLAAVYGGYFGAGLSVIILACLGVMLDDSLTRLNALKQAIAFATNTAAAVLFLFSGQVIWQIVAVMALSALIGGAAGGKLAGKMHATLLRWIVIIIGLIVAIIYFFQFY